MDRACTVRVSYYSMLTSSTASQWHKSCMVEVATSKPSMQRLAGADLQQVADNYRIGYHQERLRAKGQLIYAAIINEPGHTSLSFRAEGTV